MNKIAAFLTDRRRLLFVCTVVLAAVFGVLTAFVPINKDRTKYLADSSEMKQGLAVMYAEFPQNDENASIRVMFDGLDEVQKQDVYARLEAIENVSGVEYEDTEEYNRDGHTLFVVNTRHGYGTDEERAIEQAIGDGFSGYTMEYRNNDIQSTQVPVWVLVCAMSIAVFVLLVMSHSWLEPLLLLLTVGAAVVINLGSNIVLPYTDEMTVSIGPVIQLVLSMDYSIILLNRYRMEKERQPDKKQAMRTALAGAIPSIASSAMTTAVGLLALVFLSFKLGPELGIVLAKGVLISMLCVFTALPAMILFCDKALEKTKKKALRIPMGAFARFSRKARFVMPVLFVALFAVFFVLQNNTSITFTEKIEDPMDKVFPKKNTVVLLYRNEDEDSIDKLIADAQTDTHIGSMTGFSNTLGKPFSAAEMCEAVNSFGGGTHISEDVMRLLYALSDDERVQTLTASQFLQFVSEHVLTNTAFSRFLDPSMTEKADLFRRFADRELLLTAMNAADMAELFGIDEADVSALYLYHTMQTGVADSGVMTLAEFTDYVLHTVAQDEVYGAMIDADALSSLQQLSQYADSSYVTEKHTSSELAEMLGMETSEIDSVLLLYRLEHPGAQDLSLQELVDYVLSKSTLQSRMEDEQLDDLTLLQSVIRAAVDDAAFSSAELAELLGMDSAQTEQLYILRMSEDKPEGLELLTPQAFVSFAVRDVLTNETFKSYFDAEDASGLRSADALICAVVSEKAYTPSEMFTLLSSMSGDMTEDMVGVLYVYYGAMQTDAPEIRMTIPEFFAFVKQEILTDPTFADFLDEHTAAAVQDGEEQISSGIAQLKAEHYSRLVITSDYAEESEDTLAFIDRLNTLRQTYLQESYLIGNSVMVSEMHETFRGEYLLISLITAAAIFFVVLIAFRRPVIPLLLTLVVQCGVYLTVTVIGFYSGSIYYLALLIVQSILMGAAIDYGIVFCHAYKEQRIGCDSAQALQKAYESSIHTILTSGLILVVVLFSIGSFVSNAIISEVSITLAIGTSITILLILLVLPGMVACFDRVILGRKKK